MECVRIGVCQDSSKSRDVHNLTDTTAESESTQNHFLLHRKKHFLQIINKYKKKLYICNLIFLGEIILTQRFTIHYDTFAH